MAPRLYRFLIWPFAMYPGLSLGAMNTIQLHGDEDQKATYLTPYNFPQGRLTDHRINLTLYRLNEIITGDLDEVIGALLSEHQAGQLAALAEGQG